MQIVTMQIVTIKQMLQSGLSVCVFQHNQTHQKL